MKVVTFEPHLHAPGARMCLEYIWGINIQTVSCAGYDHNWVRRYEFQDDYAPLLPKGTILHIIGYMDNTEKNKNIPDPRNWQGSGNRSIANMFIDLGQSVSLTEEQFQQEMRSAGRTGEGTSSWAARCAASSRSSRRPPGRRRTRDSNSKLLIANC